MRSLLRIIQVALKCPRHPLADHLIVDVHVLNRTHGDWTVVCIVVRHNFTAKSLPIHQFPKFIGCHAAARPTLIGSRVALLVILRCIDTVESNVHDGFTNTNQHVVTVGSPSKPRNGRHPRKDRCLFAVQPSRERVSASKSYT